jgi:chemotaxis protein methyltransferase CheR
MNPAETLIDVIASQAGLREEISRPKVEQLLAPMDFGRQLAFVERLLGASPSGREWLEFIEPFLIHETYFYRHPSQLQYLGQNVLPALFEERKKSGRKVFRVWCAGCSSGEEVYTIGLMLRDALRSFAQADAAAWETSVIGTDLSPDMIQKASMGRYTASSGLNSFRDIPAFGRQHFEAVLSQQTTTWTADEGLRKTTSFQQRNLLKDPAPATDIDLILCRNILIYFKEADVRAILTKLEGSLRPGGVLLLGPADTMRDADGFDMLSDGRALLWKKKGRLSP